MKKSEKQALPTGKMRYMNLTLTFQITRIIPIILFSEEVKNSIMTLFLTLMFTNYGVFCAYYYDFDAENGDIKYWKFKNSTEDLVELNGFKDDNGYIHFNENLEILNAQDDYKRTGWFIQDQRYFVIDHSGQRSAPFYSWFDNTEYGRHYGDDYHARSYGGFSNTDQIYWCVSPQDTWYWNSDLNDCCLINYYNANYWKTDCRLYYNVKQKKTFDEVISKKLNSMSHADERITYYNLLVGTDSGTMYGNHQILKSLT